ncbi:MAG: VCBS repeat-containing protein, partial [Akkermansiaceae bacterium]|nr:VCBS repeat-containing protein [Akkermansiaceae bacterium]
FQQGEVLAGGRYASHCDDLLVFAAPAGSGPCTLRVFWRDGSMSEVPDVTGNSLVTVTQDVAGRTTPAPPASPAPPLFAEDPGRLQHVHHENPFDDFARQPLLPNRLGRLGPGVSWCDVDADGDDDLLAGAAAGGALAVLANDGGRFRPVAAPGGALRVAGDSTTAVTLPGSDSSRRVFLGVSNWESESGVPSIHILQRTAGGEWKLEGEATGDDVASGPLALGDVNGDGRPDIFVGGRMVRGRYPEPASSNILLNEGPGAGDPDPERWSRAFKDIGLVSGAVMADLDRDGDLDIALAREWAAPAVMLNNGAGFDDASASHGLAAHSGWWNGIAAGDFDGDGRLDLIATNWGENSKYGRSPGPDHPLMVRYGDIDGNGSFDVIEAHRDKATGKLVPERGLSCSSGAMPFIRKRIASYRAFGESDLPGIFGDGLQKMRTASAAELRHGVFLNRGDQFEFRPLPRESQWAPAFGVTVADFDGDGRLDAFLAQNFFSTQPEAPRNDGGRGMLVLGNGDGSFRVADAPRSGIAIYGEQRACATADFDRDGRSDLVVAQNDGPLRLFRNATGRPGIRVRLDGGPGNPAGIGATVRPHTAAGPGPAQVVTAGSGYWSQNSPALVVTAPGDVTEVEVAWPGGATTRHPVPKGAREVRLQRDQ